MELSRALTQGLTHSPFLKDDNALYGNHVTLKLRILLRVQEKNQEKKMAKIQ